LPTKPKLGKSATKYFFAALASFAIWGFFSIPLRNIKAFPSEEILYYRVFTSLIFIWLAIIIFRKKQLKEDINQLKLISAKARKTLLTQLILSTVFLTLNWYSFIYAINNISLTSAAFAYMVCPLLTAFGGFLILKEHLSKIKLISLVVALISIICLATGSFTDVIWSVIIAVFFAGYLILQRKMQGFDKLHLLAVQIALAVIIMLPFYIYQFHALPQGQWFWMNIIVIAIVFTIIPLFLNLYALIGIPSSTVGIMIYINPIISFAIAVLYFNEVINQQQLFAYLLLLFSVFLFNWQVIKDIFTGEKKTNN
jgi:chloramphenicol-sensitive protein RarD